MPRRKRAPLQSVSYRIPVDLDEAIYALAEQMGLPMNTVVIRLLKHGLAHQSCSHPKLPRFEEIHESA
jgi:hypothetical protein